jgi:hypothetical protein
MKLPYREHFSDPAALAISITLSLAIVLVISAVTIFVYHK